MMRFCLILRARLLAEDPCPRGDERQKLLPGRLSAGGCGDKGRNYDTGFRALVELK